jgi:TPR repeat protein
MFRFLTPVLLCLSLFSAAANAQSVQTLFERGMEAGNAGDYTRAFDLVRQAAEGGHAPAQYTLGSMYSFGQGVEPSKGEAMIWFERAASQDHPLALYNLGLYYDLGIGVAQDRTRALEWYRRGAAAGEPQAAYNAGHMMLTADGVARDTAEGLRLIEQSAGAGTADAQVSLGYIFEVGYGVSKDPAKALDYYARAERNNLGGAGDKRLALASSVLEEGIALELDGHGADALRLQDLACRYGQFYACYNAGRLRFQGRLVPRDVDGALESLRVACDRLLDVACRMSAVAALSAADATPADREHSSFYLGQLCQARDPRACHNLAVISMSPAFGTPDPDAAMKLLARSCIELDFFVSCEPYYAIYNSSLPQPSAGSASGMSILEEGVLAILSVAARGVSALSATGSYSSGAYGGYSAFSPPSTTTYTAYSPADQANFSNFMDSVRYPTVQCRPGNPYC